MTGHLATWGNAYADIRWSADGQAKELWPLRPDKMKEVKYNDKGRLTYIYTLPDGQDTVLDYGRVFHVPGLGFDGLVGYSPITMAQNAIGLAMATEEFGSKFFRNGAKPGGVLRHPGKLSEPAKDGLRTAWEKLHKGLTNSHRVAILEEGMDYTQIGIPPNDAQFLETRKFQLQEIARIFRIPPHMLADLERATFSNIEHQSIDFVVHTIRPWLVRWEQCIKNKLINGRDRDAYFAEFLVDGLLRGDSKSRNEAYAVGRQWGWLSANDILEMENKNPIGEQGDIYITPMNMIPADKINDFQPKSTPPEGQRAVEQRALPNIQAAKNRSLLTARFEPVIKDAYSRVLNRDIADIKRALKRTMKGTKDPTDFIKWIDEYYEKAPEWIERTMRPVYSSFAELIGEQAASEVGSESVSVDEFVTAYNKTFATRYVIDSRSRIKAIVRDNRSARDLPDELDPAGAVLEELDKWEESRVDSDSQDEAVQLANAIAKYVFVAAGVTRLRWVALGSDSCDFCQSLDGKVVGIEQNFVADGSTMEAGGKKLPINGNKGHAPIHKGCVCQIIPDI
jgi:HK97 family phage portal protein